MSVICQWAKLVLRLAALKPKKFFSIKIHIRDELESEDYKLTRFPFARFDDMIASVCNLRWKEQLAVKLADDFSAKGRRAS